MTTGDGDGAVVVVVVEVADEHVAVVVVDGVIGPYRFLLLHLHPADFPLASRWISDAVKRLLMFRPADRALTGSSPEWESRSLRI